MQISGKNLDLMAEAIELALAELHIQIATCPDVIKFADDIEEIEIKQNQLLRLQQRILTKQGRKYHE